MTRTPEKKKEPETDKDSWGEDIEERGYYYDDAHGYEIYNDLDQDECQDDDAPAETNESLKSCRKSDLPARSFTGPTIFLVSLTS